MAMKKRGLGNTLKKSSSSALDTFLDARTIIEDSHRNVSDLDRTSADQLREVPLDLIDRGRYQPRRHMEEGALDELAESIRAQGLMQPIVIRPLSSGRYEIVAGERRWLASRKVGLESIAAIVRHIPDEAASAMALIENIQREGLNAMEEALALQRIGEEFELTHEQVARAVGKSRSAVSNLIRLTKLPEQVRTLVERGDLEMGHARAILGVEADEMPVVAREIIDRDMSVRQAEAYVRSRQKKPSTRPRSTEKSADILVLEKEISEKLGAPVSVQTFRSGKGKLVISYASLDILDGILKHIR